MRFLFTIVVFISLLFSSCDLKTSQHALPESVGKYGQILVVIDTALENSSTGVLLDSILSQPIYGLPQTEALFSVSTVAPSGFKDILTRASNIIFIEVSKRKEHGMVVKRDVWATDQIVIKIVGNSRSILNQVLLNNRKRIVGLINDQEFNRWNEQLDNFVDKRLSRQIADSHNIYMKVPEGYLLVDSRSSDFWIKKEKSVGEHQVIQAIMVYYYPYVSDSTFSVGEMLRKRNAYTKNYIKGMTENSYLKVYDEYPVVADTFSINGMYAVRYKGLWNMENDFMGGPFVHYTVLDEKNNRIINLDAFVYAPKFNKREYVRELEAIMRSLRIPSGPPA